MNRAPIARALAPVLAVALTVVGASGCSKKSAPAPAPAASSTAPVTAPLADVCGKTIVFQSDWFPEPEYAAIYGLIGPDGVVEKEKGIYKGTIRGSDAELQIRAGGPFIGFQQVSAQMYADKDILLGYVNTDQAIQNSAKLPTVGVVAPLDKNPQMLMWPANKYDFATIGDIGKSKAKVLWFEGDTYMDYLVGQKLLRADQIDGSYDGKPDRFVAAGDVVQQGFATNEPYYYEHPDDPFGIKAWRGKKVKFLLIYDAGYRPYQMVATRPETLKTKSACLKRLVPMIQRAQVAYAKDPGPMNAAFERITRELDQFWRISKAGADDAAKKMIDLGIVGDGPDHTLGNFDRDRVARLIAILTPIYASKHKALKDGLRPEDVMTNELVDPSISLGAPAAK